MAAMTMPSRGLSPRVRGNRPRRRRRSESRRSIPACAGEPRERRGPVPPAPVYPRVCGGTLAAAAANRGTGGLSPRVRGNPGSAGLMVASVRSIPACAGEPEGNENGRPVLRVYPRVCGGTRRRGRRTSSPAGLSPRVRGNPTTGRGDEDPTGSIPACAGEPVRHHQPAGRPRVYPRVCGGTQFLPHKPIPQVGLSPRVRGNLRRLMRASDASRSIPACAGEPFQRVPGTIQIKVYPRVCGGTNPAPQRLVYGFGLSPRVRGNPVDGLGGWYEWGSIPACAGEPLGRDGQRGAGGVYPRVCGGTRILPAVVLW